VRPAITHAATTLCVAVLVWTVYVVDPIRARSGFAAEVERLSEAEGSFDTDNLISNEASYLEVVPALTTRGIKGGVYIGVGPDQNFSYIARIKPSVAYIIDIRRDNLLLHLLFKALFASTTTRVEYMSLLTGRAPPPEPQKWKTSTVAALVAYVDGQQPATSRSQLRRRLETAIMTFGVPLTRADLDTIARFHDAFVERGLDLRFETLGRRPQPYYPTLRDLLMATDAEGHTWNYLAAENDFQFLKALQERDGVVPVVGNVAGPQAMERIAEAVSARGDKVSAVYLSNVETYLHRGTQYARFVDNLNRLPHDESSVVIRSIFGGGMGSRSVVESLSVRYEQPRARYR
jgi:hypothetical protein